MLIRPVTAGDRTRWEPLWFGYNTFYGRTADTALAAEVTDSTWQRFLNPTEPVHALVAEFEGELVGVAHYLFHRSTILIADTCYLQDLFTAPEARGIGVGQALIRGVYGAARAAGVERVYWHTHESNETARALYDAVARDTGFVVYRYES